MHPKRPLIDTDQRAGATLSSRLLHRVYRTRIGVTVDLGNRAIQYL